MKSIDFFFLRNSKLNSEAGFLVLFPPIFPAGCTLIVAVEVQRLAPLPSANAHFTREERMRVNCEEPSSHTQGLSEG